MRFEKTDGGRCCTDLPQGDHGDCAVRAVTIATNDFYSLVYKEVEDFCKTEPLTHGRKKHGRSSVDSGVYRSSLMRFFRKKGFLWVPAYKFGELTRWKLRSEDLPMGRLIVSMYGHVAAVIDHTLYDNCDRRGKCVYGYWHLPS